MGVVSVAVTPGHLEHGDPQPLRRHLSALARPGRPRLHVVLDHAACGQHWLGRARRLRLPPVLAAAHQRRHSAPDRRSRSLLATRAATPVSCSSRGWRCPRSRHTSNWFGGTVSLPDYTGVSNSNYLSYMGQQVGAGPRRRRAHVVQPPVRHLRRSTGRRRPELQDVLGRVSAAGQRRSGLRHPRGRLPAARGRGPGPPRRRVGRDVAQRLDADRQRHLRRPHGSELVRPAERLDDLGLESQHRHRPTCWLRCPPAGRGRARSAHRSPSTCSPTGSAPWVRRQCPR